MRSRHCTLLQVTRPAPPRSTDTYAFLTQQGSGFTTSMYRDVSAHRPTEVEPILGSALRRARALDVPMPLLSAATVKLRIYEAAYSGNDPL